jgi:hypothetical protein
MNESGRTSPDEAPDERLERLLRRWGAEQAVRQSTVSEAPSEGGAPDLERRGSARPRSERTMGTVLRWLPLAAGLMLFGGASLLFVVVGAPGAGRRMEAPGPTEMERQLTAQLDAALGQLEANRAAADEAARREASLREALERRNEQIAADQETLTKALGDARSQLAVLEKDHAAAIGELEKQRDDWRQAAELAQRSVEDARRSLIGTEKLRQNQVAELKDRLAKTEQDLWQNGYRLTAAEATRNTLVAVAQEARGLRAERRTTSADDPAALRRLAVRQQMVRDGRLLARCTALRREVRIAPLGRLMDSLEAVLTRLDMLDATDGRAVQPFAATVAGAEVLPRIDEALDAHDLGADLRRWLVECRVVLTGVTDVG